MINGEETRFSGFIVDVDLFGGCEHFRKGFYYCSNTCTTLFPTIEKGFFFFISFEVDSEEGICFDEMRKPKCWFEIRLDILI